MLTENDIVKILGTHLQAKGFTIYQSLTTKQKGIDIIAENNKICYHVEAKGQTSARIGSNRYNLPFNSSQVKVHVSEAIYTSLRVLNGKKDEKIKAAIALPNTTLHKKTVDRVSSTLKWLGINVFYVSNNGVEEAFF